MLVRAARRLVPLLADLVFGGGQIAELLTTDPGATRVRATDDVDVIVAVTQRTAYHAFGERLRETGLQEDIRPGAPLCRWRGADGLILDVMPVDSGILGFSNQWYAAAITTAEPYVLDSDLTIRIAAAPAFLATKWVAFDQRGGGDHLGSHDLEDIITVVAGRSAITTEISESAPELRGWLAERTSAFLGHSDAAYAIEGALPDARFDSRLLGRVRNRFEQIANR